MIALDVLLDVFLANSSNLDSLFSDRRYEKTLALGQWTALGNIDFVANMKITVTVGIRQEFLAHAETLVVLGVHHIAMHRHSDSVLHFRRGNQTGLGTHRERRMRMKRIKKRKKRKKRIFLSSELQEVFFLF